MKSKEFHGAWLGVVILVLAACLSDDTESDEEATTYTLGQKPFAENETFGEYRADLSHGDPLGQRWTDYSSGDGGGGLVDDQGPAWRADGTEGRAQWRIIPDLETARAITENRWKMTVVSRIVSGDQITDYVANGLIRFLPLLRLNSQGDLIASLEGGGVHTLVTETGSEHFHTFEVEYDPSLSQATFRFDGHDIESWGGSPTSQNMVVWGNGSSGTDGVAHYRSVTFEIFGMHRELFFSDVFVGGQEGDMGTNHYRIPSLIVAPDRSLLAFIEGRPSSRDPGHAGEPINLSMKRSIDCGRRWGTVEVIHENPAFDYSDPRPLIDHTSGTLLLFYTQWPDDCAQNGDCAGPEHPNQLLLRTSRDSGQTWSEARDLNSQVKPLAWRGEGVGGRAQWRVVPDDQVNTDASLNGWKMTVRSRIVSGEFMTDYYANGSRRFLPILSRNENGDLIASLEGGGSHVLSTGPSADDFHDYEIEFHPQSQKATFRFDSEDIETWSGATTAQNMIVWGNGSTAIDGVADYRSIHFEVLAGGVTFGYDVYELDADPIAQGWEEFLSGLGRGYPFGWRSINAGPGIGIQLSRQVAEQADKNGRLIIPALHRDENSIIKALSIYSDDGGESWLAGEPTPLPWTNESEIVELADGQLLLSCRTSYMNETRQHYLSKNAGESWFLTGDPGIAITRVDASLIRFSAVNDGDDADRLLFSGPLGDPIGSGNGRSHMGIWVSYDEGLSFVNPVQVASGHGAYSALQRLPDGSIGLLYEATGSTLVRFLNFDVSFIEKN